MKTSCGSILAKIQERQQATFCLLEDFYDNDHPKSLSRKRRGLYWIWSKLEPGDLENTKTRDGTMEVPIEKLACQRHGLANICGITHKKHKGFVIVYNGIGGYKTKTPTSSGLRERILQEFNCNDPRTGTLNLLNRPGKFQDKGNWAVSYFDFEDETNSDLKKKFKLDYAKHAKYLEMNWRIEYGTPILTRH